MAIKAIALDLDGTLLDGQRNISQANLLALAEAGARGVRMIIMTGRRFDAARPLLAPLPCPALLVASNGALISTLDGEVAYRNFLPREAALQVLQASERYRPHAVVIFDVPGRGQVVMQDGASPEGPLGWYLASSPAYLLQVPDLASAVSTDPVQVMFGGTPALLKQGEDALRASPVAARVHLTWTRYDSRNISLLDVMNKGCSKGEALRWLAARLHIEREEIMAIGDNFNDLEMLEFAGTPVVMSNAPRDFLDRYARRTLSNEEDGVAQAIRTWALDAGNT